MLERPLFQKTVYYKGRREARLDSMGDYIRDIVAQSRPPRPDEENLPYSNISEFLFDEEGVITHKVVYKPTDVSIRAHFAFEMSTSDAFMVNLGLRIQMVPYPSEIFRL